MMLQGKSVKDVRPVYHYPLDVHYDGWGEGRMDTWIVGQARGWQGGWMAKRMEQIDKGMDLWTHGRRKADGLIDMRINGQADIKLNRRYKNNAEAASYSVVVVGR